MNGEWTAILVFSTSHALRIERLLTQAGVASKLIPVPRTLGSNCGVCVRIPRESKEQAADILDRGDIETDGLRDYS